MQGVPWVVHGKFIPLRRKTSTICGGGGGEGWRRPPKRTSSLQSSQARYNRYDLRVQARYDHLWPQTR